MALTTALVALGPTALQQVYCYPFPTWLDIRTAASLHIYGVLIPYKCRSGYTFTDGSDDDLKNMSCSSNGLWDESLIVCEEIIDPIAEEKFLEPVESPYGHIYGYGAISFLSIFILMCIILDMDQWYYVLKPVIRPVRKAIRRCCRKHCVKTCGADDSDCSDEEDEKVEMFKGLSRLKMKIKKEPRIFYTDRAVSKLNDLSLCATEGEENLLLSPAHDKADNNIIPTIVTTDMGDSDDTDDDNVSGSENGMVSPEPLVDLTISNESIPQRLERPERPEKRMRMRTLSIDENMLGLTPIMSRESSFHADERLPLALGQPRRGSVISIHHGLGMPMEEVNSDSSSSISSGGKTGSKGIVGIPTGTKYSSGTRTGRGSLKERSHHRNMKPSLTTSLSASTDNLQPENRRRELAFLKNKRSVWHATSLRDPVAPMMSGSRMSTSPDATQLMFLDDGASVGKCEGERVGTGGRQKDWEVFDNMLVVPDMVRRGSVISKQDIKMQW